jgi:hypothetical protein
MMELLKKSARPGSREYYHEIMPKRVTKIYYDVDIKVPVGAIEDEGVKAMCLSMQEEDYLYMQASLPTQGSLLEQSIV